MMDLSDLAPSDEDIYHHFVNCEIICIQRFGHYPRVEVLLIRNNDSEEHWAWDRWHGGGFWHQLFH